MIAFYKNSTYQFWGFQFFDHPTDRTLVNDLADDMHDIRSPMANLIQARSIILPQNFLTGQKRFAQGDSRNLIRSFLDSCQKKKSHLEQLSSSSVVVVYEQKEIIVLKFTQQVVKQKSSCSHCIQQFNINIFIITVLKSPRS